MKQKSGVDRLAPRPHENFVVFKGRLNAEALEAMQKLAKALA